MRTRWVALGAVLALGAVTCADDDAADGGTAAGSGAELYTAHCATCHGDDGSGGTGPPLGDGAANEELSVDEMIDVVRDGGNGMPSFATRLDDAELDAVVRYVRDDLG